MHRGLCFLSAVFSAWRVLPGPGDCRALHECKGEERKTLPGAASHRATFFSPLPYLLLQHIAFDKQVDRDTAENQGPDEGDEERLAGADRLTCFRGSVTGDHTIQAVEAACQEFGQSVSVEGVQVCREEQVVDEVAQRYDVQRFADDGNNLRGNIFANQVAKGGGDTESGRTRNDADSGTKQQAQDKILESAETDAR